MKENSQAAVWPDAERESLAVLTAARLLFNEGQQAKAILFCQATLSRLAGHPEVVHHLRALIARTVPTWHFRLLRDAARNDAYETALKHAVEPDSFVLEIGTGTGILSMMAARAGARRVVTCEVNPAIAQAARENVAKNGLDDRIEVITKHSSGLDLRRDLGGERADVLVSEIIGNRVLGEGVLQAHEHALAELAKPQAKVIPIRGAVRVALALDKGFDRFHIEPISGFDLTAFNRLAPNARMIRPDSEDLVIKSEPKDLFTFDFACRETTSPARSSVTCTATGGIVNGIAQWISLALDEATHYENWPRPGAVSAWMTRFYPFAEPIETKPGEEIVVYGSHDRYDVTVWSRNHYD